MIPNFYSLKATLGELFTYNHRIVKFVKVTRKGFNFIDVVTDRCILRRPVYDKNFTGIIIPLKYKTFVVQIPTNVWIKKVEH